MARPNALKMRRQMAGLTQRELAAKADVSQQYLSKLEQDQRTIKPRLAITLARLIDCSPAEIMPELALMPQPETENELELEILARLRRLSQRDRVTFCNLLRAMEHGEEAPTD